MYRDSGFMGFFALCINGLDPEEGIKEQLKSAVRVKPKITHYFGILGILISASLLTLLISYILFGNSPSFKMIKTEPYLIPLLFLVILLGGPIFEEVFGLRGYVLPVLLKTKSPLISSIIVGTYNSNSNNPIDCRDLCC